MNIYLSNDLLLFYQSAFTYFVWIEFGLRVTVVIAQNNYMIIHFFLIPKTNFHVTITNSELSKTPLTIEVRNYVFHKTEFTWLVFYDFFVKLSMILTFDDEDMDGATITSTC